MKYFASAACRFLLAAGPVGAAPAPSGGSNDFQGKINRVANDSVPAWPHQPTAPRGAPNVILILLDDVGFSAMGTFGGVADEVPFRFTGNLQMVVVRLQTP